jgi:glutamyl-Q tRNA(Asp) synthetase
MIGIIMITRFAPSPTGYLHLGHAYSAWLGWRRARADGGDFLLRLEDIDATRCKPEFAAAILEDLQWLGFDWDGEVRLQSAHLPAYQAALDTLEARGLLYPCTRSDIARAIAAPHGGQQKYPGTCRNLTATERLARIAEGTNYALRLNTTLALEEVSDIGYYEEDICWIDADPAHLGDVVLGRRWNPTSYHLCVVHDDAVQRVTHVIRGRDLEDSTHVHVLLQRLLNLPTPIYAHHPLLTDDAGKRLAKRDGAATLRAMREAGVPAGEVLDRLRMIGSQNGT